MFPVVERKAVDAARERGVEAALQIARREGKGIVEGITREGFRAYEIASERAPDRAVEIRLAAWILRASPVRRPFPELVHRHVAVLRGLVAVERTPVRFEMELVSRRIEPLLEALVVTLGLELVLRPHEVATELFVLGRPGRRPEPGYHGEERNRIVSAAALELVREVIGPRTVLRLVAIHQDEGEPRLGRRDAVCLQVVEQMVEMRVDRGEGHLVRFQRRGLHLRRRGMRALAGAGVAEAIDAVRRLNGRDVAVEAELRLRLRGPLRPDELLHAELGRDPRTSRRRVAGTVVKPEFESEPLRLRDGECHHLEPGGTHIRHPRAERILEPLHRIPADILDVENRRAPHARLLHRLKIARNPILRDISPLPMPPHVDPALRRRMRKDVGQRGRRNDFRRITKARSGKCSRPKHCLSHRRATVIPGLRIVIRRIRLHFLAIV